MKRRFFIFSAITMIVMAMSFVGCDKHETIEPSQTTEDTGTHLKSLSYFSFNASNAVDYALDYTIQGINNDGTLNSNAWSTTYYNSDYKVWYVNGLNRNDCANFVSQCLADNSGGNANTNSGWEYNDQGTSTTTDDVATTSWINANSQYNYFKNNYYVTNRFIRSIDYSGESDPDFRTFKSTLSLGDLVYFETEDNYGYMVIDHVMIVTNIVDMGSYNIVYVSGHTINQKNEALHDVFTNYGEPFFARTIEF